MIGIVIPAHNEEECLGQALAAACRAANHEGLQGEPVKIVVVLDACTDASEAIACAWPVTVLSIHDRNVGRARSVGADHLIASGARWLAFTDADSVVSERWLVDQLDLNSDVVCGSVSVDDWSAHGVHAHALRQHFEATYRDVDGHAHVHGANLGVSTPAYQRVGGFPPLACSEDVALVNALLACGAKIAWSAVPRVTTSSRRHARASGGFGDTLLEVVRRVIDGAIPGLCPVKQ